MSRITTARLALSLGLGWGTLAAPAARAQVLNSPTPPPSIAAPSTQLPRRPATALAEALAANPITAPYRLSVLDQGRKVVLAGRVGDSRVHDVAVRTAIAMGVPITDQIVIDTAAYALAGQATGGWGPAQPSSIISSYTYPPPLFGRFDDPFFGLEPPLVSYAPWWGAAGSYRLAQDQAINQAPPANAQRRTPTRPRPRPCRRIRSRRRSTRTAWRPSAASCRATRPGSRSASGSPASRGSTRSSTASPSARSRTSRLRLAGCSTTIRRRHRPRRSSSRDPRRTSPRASRSAWRTSRPGPSPCRPIGQRPGLTG